jgi:hypothetical protein
MTSVLTITSGPDAGHRFDLPDGEILLIGRGPHCQIRLADGSISRVQCRVTHAGGRVTLQDAGSRWGTFVNGRRVDACDLAVGDEVTVGETTLTFNSDAGFRATTLPPQWARPAARRAASGTSEDPGGVGILAAKSVPRAAPIDPQQFLGQAFLRFQIREHVASSRSGSVFAADDPKSRERVALKVFEPGAFPTASSRKRFLRAVDRMVGLRHENLVALRSAGRHDGLMFTVSEFVPGMSAAAMIQKIGIAGMLDWRTTLRIALDIARALEFARDQQIVHRNITPRNILIRESDGRAKLNDLILAKALEGDEQGAITQPGEVVGELQYLSPEQLGSGQPCDCRSDIYQLGAALYALLTGRPPFDGHTAADIIRQTLTAEPESPRRFHLAVPSMLEGIVLRMLSKHPGERPQEPAQLVKDLESAARYLG